MKEVFGEITDVEIEALKKERQQGFVDGQRFAYQSILEKSIWISEVEGKAIKQMPELRHYLRQQIKELV